MKLVVLNFKILKSLKDILSRDDVGCQNFVHFYGDLSFGEVLELKSYRL